MATSLFFSLYSLVPLVLGILLVVFLKQVATAVDAHREAMERRLLAIERALVPADQRDEGRWPPET